MNNEENVVIPLKPTANTLWFPVKHLKTKQCTKNIVLK